MAMAAPAPATAGPGLSSNLANPNGPGASRGGQQLNDRNNYPTGTVTGNLGNVTPGPTTADIAAGENFASKLLGGADFMTPAMQAYVNQFQQSQAQQSQALNAGLQASLSGLGQRRDAAAAVAAQLPEQYQQAYAQTQGEVNNAVKQSVGAFGAYGKQAINGGMDMAANAEIPAQERAAGMAELPTLNAGIQAQYSQGQTALANTNMQNQAALQQQGQSFDQNLALAQAQFQQQQGLQNQKMLDDLTMAKLQSSLGVQGNLANMQNEVNLGLVQTPAQQQAAQLAAGNNQTAQASGFPGGYAQLQQTLASPTYSGAVSALQKAGSNQGQRATAIKGITDYYTLLALQSQGLVTPNEVATAQGVTLPALTKAPSYFG